MEIFTGAYTSGKSEIAINRALMLKEQGDPPILVDLDTVEPAYTLRPIKKTIEKMGIKVVTQESSFGLGETGNIITVSQKNCLFCENNLVIDVGYGVGGLDVLDILTGIDEEPNLQIFIVINTSKPETSTVEGIVEYVNWSKGLGDQKWKKFKGIISNSHFGKETTIDDTLKGFEITKQAAKELNLPIRAISALESIAKEFNSPTHEDIEIWPLQRYMPEALW